MIRAFFMVLAVLATVWPVGRAGADEASWPLYAARTIVTGTGEANRLIGFRDCLRRVLVRVSGDQRLAIDARLAPMDDTAGQLVASFKYRDRLEGIPIHDEQGSHDRPHDLTCFYDHATVDALLASLGSRPWLAHRPALAVVLSVEQAGKHRYLDRDGDAGSAMRDSLSAAAEPMAMSVVVPPMALLDALPYRATELTQPDAAALAAAAGGELALLGDLRWSDAHLGWIATWRLWRNDESHQWSARGVSFDEAFRLAVRGAAQILSENGDP
jgi:hypothetical protein